MTYTVEYWSTHGYWVPSSFNESRDREDFPQCVIDALDVKGGGPVAKYQIRNEETNEVIYTWPTEPTPPEELADELERLKQA